MTGTSEAAAAVASWRMAACHTPGSGHLERNLPCQDRASAWLAPRPALVLMDGRGSATLSQVGAAAALVKLQRAIDEWEPWLAEALDTRCPGLAAVAWQSISLRAYHTAAAEQLALAAWFGANPREFEFTLTMAVVGRRSLGWLAVGDSPLVMCRGGVAGLVTPPDTVEFANQTTFVTASPRSTLGMKGGILPVDGVEALVAMSDGAASRFIDFRAQCPAGAVAQMVRHIATRAWQSAEIEAILTAPDWDRATRDDRSLAILARMRGAPGLHSPGSPVDSNPASHPATTTSHV